MLQAKLELRQSQSLIITPQLQQAIKLLQLSNLDLLNFLEQEIEQNPLLDWAERAGDSEPPAEAPAHDAGAAEDNGQTQELNGYESLETAQTGSDTSDSPDDSISLPEPPYETLSLYSPGKGASDGPGASFEEFTAQQITLRDHLRQQLHIVVVDPVERLIGDHLIDLVDEAGYCRGSVDEIAERLGASPAAVESVLKTIQSLDPAGVGARSLAECLAIQLRELDRLDPAMQTLLDHLELLGVRDYAALQRLCGVDQEDMNEMVAEIQALNPRPGADFGAPTSGSVIPDILVERDRSGGWNIQLNDETLPRICVNHGFYSSIKHQIRNKKDKTYIQNCMTTANWLARSLDQRRRTMLKVAHEIIRQQESFLERGVRGLKPLALKDVAERIGMHESTVSRVTSNKYMQTPRGTFELKYFFTSAISAAGAGDAHSSEAVKYRIKELIDGESAAKVLSDDKIVTILRHQGIDIARRTVAKYRESLRIPSSVQRRRQKLAAGRQLFEEAGGSGR